MDASRDEVKDLASLVGDLRVEVAKLQAVCPQITQQAETLTHHAEGLAELRTWRDEHEKSDAARSRRYAGWAGLVGALVMKIVDWAHAHATLFGIPAGR